MGFLVISLFSFAVPGSLSLLHPSNWEADSVHCVSTFFHLGVCPRTDTAEVSSVRPFPWCCLNLTVPYSYSHSRAARLPFHQPLAPITERALAQTGALPHRSLLLCWSLCANITIVSPPPCTWAIYFLTMTFCWCGKIVISEFYLSLLLTWIRFEAHCLLFSSELIHNLRV